LELRDSFVRWFNHMPSAASVLRVLPRSRSLGLNLEGQIRRGSADALTALGGSFYVGAVQLQCWRHGSANRSAGSSLQPAPRAAGAVRDGMLLDGPIRDGVDAEGGNVSQAPSIDHLQGLCGNLANLSFRLCSRLGRIDGSQTAP